MAAEGQSVVVGVGSPLVDVLARVSEDFLATVPGAKGGMELLDQPGLQALLRRLPQPVVRAPGGSAANTLSGLARLGLGARFLGKLGRDEAATFYRRAMATAGIDLARCKDTAAVGTGHCVCLITPDSQRTCRTFLGAASALTPAEVSPADFAGARLAHIEGYALFNRELARRLLECAKAAGCQVSLDLAAFEVVQANRDVLDELLDRYVDLVFANEDEAAAYCGTRDPEAACQALRPHCRQGAVKAGAAGAWLWRGTELVHVAAKRVHAVDTTGAGDLWAAGYLFGHLRGRDLATCGLYGAITGAEVVQVLGAVIPDARWTAIKETLQ